MTTYIATTATKNDQTIVVVDNSEAMSLDTMAALAAHGNACARFITTEEMFVAYSEGRELEVDIESRGTRNIARVLKVAQK